MSTITIETEDATGQLYMRSAVASGDDEHGATFELDMTTAGTLLLTVTVSSIDGTAERTEKIGARELITPWLDAMRTRIRNEIKEG